jgi:hypothetical protein
MTGEWCRRDRNTMAVPHATEAASSPKNQAEPQPQSGALTSASATRPTAAASSPAPMMSGRPETFSSRLSGTTRSASATAASPTGTLIQNTQRQLTWTRAPPMTGPRAAPSAPSADQVPIAFGRAAAGTAASSSDSDAGTIAPAPAACTTRAAISAPTPGASPHSTEPRLNPASPATNSRRRPTRSAHRPAGTSTAANTIVYAFSTQDSELRLVPGYCLLMYGNARLTMNRSRLDMNTARDSTPTTAVTRRVSDAALMALLGSVRHG